jgi:hypothetical protein
MVRARGRAVGMPLQGENANADPVPRVLTLGYDGRSLSGSAAHPLKGGEETGTHALREMCAFLVTGGGPAFSSI